MPTADSVNRMCRRRMAMTGSVALTVAFVASTGAVAAQERHGEVRTLPYRTGVPLRDQLPPCNPGDVVQFHRYLGTFVDDPVDVPVDAVIDLLIRRSNLAVLMDVETVSGVVSENDTWISTHITGVVQEVLFSRTRTLRPGERLTSVLSGSGEATIGRCLVRTGEQLKVAKGRLNLMFLGAHVEDRNRPFFPTAVPFLIDNGRALNLSALEPGSTTNDPLHGQPLDLFRQRVRAVGDPASGAR